MVGYRRGLDFILVVISNFGPWTVLGKRVCGLFFVLILEVIRGAGCRWAVLLSKNEVKTLGMSLLQ